MKVNSIAFNMADGTFKTNHSKTYSGTYHCVITGELGYKLLHLPHEIILMYNSQREDIDYVPEEQIVYPAELNMMYILKSAAESYCTMMRNFYNNALKSLNNA